MDGGDGSQRLLLTISGEQQAYVGSDDGNLYAYDALGTGPTCSGSPKTCSPLWTANPAGGLALQVPGSPAVVHGIVHVGTSSFFNYGNVYAYDAGGTTNCSGSPKVCEPLWRAPMSSFIDNAAMVWGGVVYYGDGLGMLAAFDADGGPHCSGTPTICPPLWTAQVGSSIHGSPTYFNGQVLVGADDGNIYAFDANGVTGCSGTPTVCQPLWTAETGTGSGIYATPAVSTDGTLFVATLNGPAFAFDAYGVTNCSGSPVACDPLWTAAGTTGSYASPAIYGDRVVFTKRHEVLVYDKNGVQDCTTPPSSIKTCSPLWTTTPVPGATWFGDQYFSSPTVANDVLFIGALDGRLYAYDAAGSQACSGTPTVCDPVWSWKISDEAIWSSPTIVNGRVFVGSSDKNLWSFGF